jgi:endonuclease/exonuclease/phosphatase family metal-dependent hydrolase
MAVETRPTATRAEPAQPAAPRSISVATWNIHAAIGADGRYAPSRIIDVLEEVDADVVALQEVASQQEHEDFLIQLERATGYHVVSGPLRQKRGNDFGNALLSRYPITSVTHHDLAIDGYEPRGAIDVCLDVGLPQPLRVIGTHLGLRPGERREQVKRLLAVVEREAPHPTLLMGDVNEWYLWGRPLKWMHAHFHPTHCPPTFPSRRPVFALDRIWVAPARCLTRIARHASPLARIASDHLPLKAELVLQP